MKFESFLRGLSFRWPVRPILEESTTKWGKRLLPMYDKRDKRQPKTARETISKSTVG
jgi:hypothetical protein